MPPKITNSLDWAIVRLGEDFNWWVKEISDPTHWDVDSLSILDPRQLEHLIEQCEPLKEYGFDMHLINEAFYPFRIEREAAENSVLLSRMKEYILEIADPVFALPDLLDEEQSPYADLLDALLRARVKMINDTKTLAIPVTIDEVEEYLRDLQNNAFMEQRAIHCFNEINEILEYAPGSHADSDEDEDADAGAGADESYDDIEVEHEGDDDFSGDETTRWDDDEEGDEDEDEEDSDEDEASDEDSDEDEAPRRGRRRQ